MPSYASENGSIQYGLGSAQFLIGAIPPFPGFYINNQLSHYSAKRLNDKHGHKINIPNFKADVTVNTFRVLYVTDKTVMGKQIWLQAVIPYIIKQKVMGDTEAGFADLTLTTGLRWSNGPNHYTTGLDYALPTGHYHSGTQNNDGLNHWSIQPVLAYHYLDVQNPQWEFSMGARYIINSTNTDTHYRSGQQLVTDYALGHFFGPFRVGVTGFWLKQITDDSGSGVQQAGITDGNKTDGFAMGPSLRWTLPHGSILSTSYQKEFDVKNKAEGYYLWLNFSAKI